MDPSSEGVNTSDCRSFDSGRRRGHLPPVPHLAAPRLERDDSEPIATRRGDRASTTYQLRRWGRFNPDADWGAGGGATAGYRSISVAVLTIGIPPNFRGARICRPLKQVSSEGHETPEGVAEPRQPIGVSTRHQLHLRDRRRHHQAVRPPIRLISLRTPNSPGDKCPAPLNSRFRAAGRGRRESRNRRDAAPIHVDRGQYCARSGGRSTGQTPPARSLPAPPGRRDSRDWLSCRLRARSADTAASRARRTVSQTSPPVRHRAARKTHPGLIGKHRPRSHPRPRDPAAPLRSSARARSHRDAARSAGLRRSARNRRSVMVVED